MFCSSVGFRERERERGFEAYLHCGRQRSGDCSSPDVKRCGWDLTLMMQGLDLDLAELAPLQLKASRLLHRDKPFGLVVVQGGVVSRTVVGNTWHF